MLAPFFFFYFSILFIIFILKRLLAKYSVNLEEVTCGTMGETFRQRLANDKSFSVRVQEPEKLCPYSKAILDEQNPDSVDHESILNAMNTEEFQAHVREAIRMKEADEQEQQQQQQTLKKKKRVLTDGSLEEVN